MLTLIGCLAAHALMASVIASPWWVPDLTLVGLILAVVRRPGQWLRFSVCAGLFVLLWATRFPGQIFCGYLVLGGIVQLLTRQWDLTDQRMQALLIALASLATTLAALWLDDLVSLPLLALTVVRMLITIAMLPIVEHVT